MSAWFRRFGLHLAAAIGATGIFVTAAAVGASQTRQQVEIVASPAAAVRTRTPLVQRKPQVVAATPTTTPRGTATPRAASAAAANANKVVPERSLAGSIKAVSADGVEIVGVGGREWLVSPAPGALIRLNGKAARLEALQPGDKVVILGQAQAGAPGNRFLAHAITARRT